MESRQTEGKKVAPDYWRRRPVGRPRKAQETEKKVTRRHYTVLPSWSRSTKAYVKLVTDGKGAPCKIWSIPEKKQLLEALKKHSHQDWDSLCKMVPTRSKEEIQDYLHQLKGGEQYKSRTSQEALDWAPIESWLDMNTEMVHYEQEDLSKILSRVFSIIGNFSSFPERTSSVEYEPDYRKLYGYIAAVMDESLSMPDLTPLESAIIADLMHGLGDKLRMSDTSLQRKVMCWKYKMLSYRFDYDDVRSSLDRIRKALTNDFSDLQKDSNRGVSSLPSFSKAPSSSSDQSSTQEASTSQTAAPVFSSSSADEPQTSRSDQSPGSSQRPCHESAAGILSSPAGQSPSTSTGSVTASAQSTNGMKGTDSEEQSPPKRGRGRKRIHDWRRPIEKPRLYSMNPFCVPIRLLRLKPLLNTAPVTVTDPVLALNRQRNISMSSVQSVTSDTSGVSEQSQNRGKTVEQETSEGLDRNNIRQVTGLFYPSTHRTNKKRAASGSVLPAKTQVSAKTMNAITAALALKKKGAVPGAALSKNLGGHPQQEFRCMRLPGGMISIVPVAASGSVTHLEPSSGKSNTTRYEFQPPSVSSVPRTKPVMQKVYSITGTSPTKYRSPLRAPVAGCSVSVGTSEENALVKPSGHRKVPASTDHGGDETQLSEPSTSTTGHPPKQSSSSVTRTVSFGTTRYAESQLQAGEIAPAIVPSSQASPATQGSSPAQPASSSQTEQNGHAASQQPSLPAQQTPGRKRVYSAIDQDLVVAKESSLTKKSRSNSASVHKDGDTGLTQNSNARTNSQENEVQHTDIVIFDQPGALGTRYQSVPQTVTQTAQAKQIVFQTQPSVRALSSHTVTQTQQPRKQMKSQSESVRQALAQSRTGQHIAHHPETPITPTGVAKHVTQQTQPNVVEIVVYPPKSYSAGNGLAQAPGGKPGGKGQPQRRQSQKPTSVQRRVSADHLPRSTSKSLGSNSPAFTAGAGSLSQGASPATQKKQAVGSRKSVNMGHASSTSADGAAAAKAASLQSKNIFSKSASQEGSQLTNGPPKGPSPATVCRTVPVLTNSGDHTPLPAIARQAAGPSGKVQSHMASTSQNTLLTASSSGTPQTAPSPGKGTKSSFKRILAQVAAPHTTGKGSGEDPRISASVQSKPAEPYSAADPDNQQSEQNPQSCPSSPSLSPSSSPTRQRLKLTKKFLSKSPGQSSAAPSKRRRGRPRKEEAARGSKPLAQKKARFIDSLDISKMQVEYVTPDAAIERLHKSMNQNQKGTYEIERQKQMKAAEASGQQPVSLVMDKEEISLVSI